MAKQEHLDILKQGVVMWNQWRQEYPDIRPDLSKADLQGAHLDKIDLHDAELDSADFYKAELREANLRKANLRMAHLYRTDFSGADLSEAILRGADLVRSKLIGTILYKTDLRWTKLGEADLSKADLTGSAVYAASAWDVTLENTIQSGLAITKDGTSAVTVDNLEVAQFIYMLINYKKLRDVLNSVIKKGVLLLGRFSDGGLELLKAIAMKLREYQYLPMIFDFDSPDTRDYTETVITLVGLSRFVIVDLSGPSVPQELYATVPNFDIPFVPFIIENRKIYSTFRDFLRFPWVLSPIPFADEKQLIDELYSKLIQPAETKLHERQIAIAISHKEFKQVFPSKTKAEKQIQINDDEMYKLPFQSFRKKALLQARALTEEDFTQRKGIIQTREGAASFQPGDYLARGIQNEEWPITQKHFAINYEQVSEPDKEGFASYRATNIRQAYQVPEAFTVRRANGDLLLGKPGDYLVRSGDRVWVTDNNIFEDSYELISF